MCVITGSTSTLLCLNKQANKQYTIWNVKIMTKLKSDAAKIQWRHRWDLCEYITKTAAISQAISCCIRIQFTLGQHWLVYWSGVNQARNHHGNQWWHILPVHYHASFGLNELSRRIPPQRQPLVALGILFMKIPSANSVEKAFARTHECQGLEFAYGVYIGWSIN